MMDSSDLLEIESTLDSIQTLLIEQKTLQMEQTLLNHGWRELKEEKWFAPFENEHSHEGASLEMAYFSLKRNYLFTKENAALKVIKQAPNSNNISSGLLIKS